MSALAAIDFLLITALPEERDAVLQRLPGHKLLPPAAGDASVYYRATFPVTYSDGTTSSYELVVTFPPGISRAPAAALAATAIRRWRPAYVLLVGIAGGISENGAALGDILIADRIIDYEVGKATPRKLARRWHPYDIHAGLLQRAMAFTSGRWYGALAGSRPVPGRPVLRFGPIASGDKIVEDPALLASLLRDWPKMVGVEMEAGGVAPAARQTDPPPGFFMIRAVSDLADPAKESPEVQGWRPYACAAAAAFTVAFLRSGPVISAHAVSATAPEAGSVAGQRTTPRATPETGTSPALAAFERALEKSDAATTIRADEFMQALAADVHRCAAAAGTSANFNERLTAAIAASAVMAEAFSIASRRVADHDVRQAAERLFAGFADLIALFPRDALPALRAPDLGEEVARFLAHELFLTLFARLIAAGRWDTIRDLFGQHIFMREHPLGLGPGEVPYAYLAAAGGALDARAMRHGRHDTPFRVTQLYARHETGGPLAAVVSIEALVDADALLWLRKEVDRLNTPADQSWRPHLLPHWSALPSLFRQIVRDADAHGLAHALGLATGDIVWNPALLRQVLHDLLETPEADFPWRPTALAELHRVGTL